MYINPIDISIVLLLFILFLIGFKNGIIDEFKKTINLFLSIISTQFILAYLPNSILQNEFMLFIVFIFLLIVLIYSLGFIMNIIIYNLDSVKIEKNIDKIIGGAFAPIRGFFIIVLLIIAFNMFPIQKSFKDRLTEKLNNDSYLFKSANDLKVFLVE